MFRIKNVLREEEGGGEQNGGGLFTPPPGNENQGQGNENQNQGNENPSAWYYAEGIAGEGDKPEYMLDKYSTIEEQAKGYAQLQTMYSKTVGGFEGAPEQYEFAASENSNINPESAEIKMLMAAVGDIGKEANMNNDTYNSIINSVHNAVQEQRSNQLEATIKSLDNFEGRQKDMLQMATSILRPDQVQALNNTMSDAAGFEAVEAMLNAAKGSSLPGNVQVQGVDGEEIKQGVRDYDGSQHSRNKLVDNFNKVYGGDGSTGKIV